ncbi:hypothetical protein [Hymenobacter sp. BT559]|uniref:hypothetical protein n=1 Tax=Hymenobacter sp. BT559 TaxID=2795729 RepID=UPI0018EBE491|nr:hypothetical protein [Hymenobacter sp. BT559]MBJ6146299.1 hypothetical protein [Hymenobacter sp. BT559]
MEPTIYAHETRIRNAFASVLRDYRKNERVAQKEVKYIEAGARADMRTVDHHNIIREWEFKIEADYSALGQILVYVALARKEFQYRRLVRGVLAAFTFPENLVYTIEAMNLGIELYTIPGHLQNAGNLGATLPEGPPQIPTSLI